ncbi:EARP and GARP complex-interacting protein 1-like [Tubulanus polymorphus]|uniref:EARP and GARP complex-interacting protein 1-like n=1 Tax=Tubulanus polymorphus TaxID=672921 RepID=UPI003DA444EB
MEDDAPVIYGLEFQARSLTAQVAETDAIRFLVGTQSLRFDNQIHQIDFDDENNQISKNVFLHRDGEIWHISSSPANKSILATCYNSTSEAKAEMKAALWRIPTDFDATINDENSSASHSLEKLSQIGVSDSGDAKCTIWHPGGDGSQLISLVDNNIYLWDINESGEHTQMISSGTLDGKGQPKFTTGQWNPHHNCNQVATANDTVIRGWDLRTMSQEWVIENAHEQLVRDLDFNPNKQYYLATCGDDCKVKFWDIRKTLEPVTILADHSHWVWKVRYNHFHDQLVLSASSDSRVILTNAITISSEPFGHLADEDEEEIDEDHEPKEKSEDGVIAASEEHEDSVYAVEWSTADPWLYASLSYDGRLVINRVPRAEKYKILL